MPKDENTNCCKLCSRKFKTPWESVMCCLLAPETPTGWCAWCGDDASRVFCNPLCSVSFMEDKFKGFKKRPKALNAPQV